jgi:hypothetical protein
MLSAACQHGWQPQGTRNEGVPDWDGEYVANDGRDVTEVTAADAAALAQALDLARANGDLGPGVVAGLDHFLMMCRLGAFWIY